MILHWFFTNNDSLPPIFEMVIFLKKQLPFLTLMPSLSIQVPTELITDIRSESVGITENLVYHMYFRLDPVEKFVEGVDGTDLF